MPLDVTSDGQRMLHVETSLSLYLAIFAERLKAVPPEHTWAADALTKLRDFHKAAFPHLTAP